MIYYLLQEIWKLKFNKHKGGLNIGTHLINYSVYSWSPFSWWKSQCLEEPGPETKNNKSVCYIDKNKCIINKISPTLVPLCIMKQKGKILVYWWSDRGVTKPQPKLPIPDSSNEFQTIIPLTLRVYDLTVCQIDFQCSWSLAFRNWKQKTEMWSGQWHLVYNILRKREMQVLEAQFDWQLELKWPNKIGLK